MAEMVSESMTSILLVDISMLLSVEKLLRLLE